MSTKAFDSIPKRVVQKDGKFLLEVIENYTPSNRTIPKETLEKMEISIVEKVETARRKMLKSK